MNKSPRIRRTSLASCLGCWSLIVLSLTAGCAPGDGQGLDQDGNPLTSATPAAPAGPGASGNPNATLAWVQANVFGGVCSQCHTGAGAPLGLVWSSATNTCANQTRTSAEVPTLKEIDAGNPGTSYVIWKISGQGPAGEPIQGVQMPAQNPPLAAATIQNVHDWIADGLPGC
jgi:hypothetical protein